MLLIDASTSLLQIGQTFNGDSSKGVGKRPFSMRIADQIKRQWVAIFDENHRPDSMRFGGHFSREYAPKEVVLEHVVGVGARNFAQRFVQRQRGQILAFSIFVDFLEEHTL